MYEGGKTNAHKSREAEMDLHLHSVSFFDPCSLYSEAKWPSVVYVLQFQVLLYITALTVVYLSPVISELIYTRSDAV